MSPPALRDIQLAVVAWHNRQPLAARIDSSQVHSIGWVALPFLRPPQGVEPTLDAPSPAAPPAVPARSPWRLPVFGGRAAAGHGPRPVFSEAFIDGLSAPRAAAFALLHGISEAPAVGEDAWPQRRIDVDSDLAERSAGGWPVELWLISAAIDVGKARRRVLVAADGHAVAGPRHWRRAWIQALAVAGLATAVAAAALIWGMGSRTPDAAPTTPSAAAPASAVASAATQPPIPASAASAPVDKASDAAVASDPGVAASAGASAPAEASPVADGSDVPPPDIRPQLVKPLPNRRGPPPAPMLAQLGDRRATTKAPDGPASEAAQPQPKQRRSEGASEAATGASPAPYRGAATPEQIRPGMPAQGPLIALVSPGWRTRAEAEAMLGRMTEHLKATMAQQTGLRGEVIETPEGWRAAVYPFATREEAAILNATMVARGWGTRSVSF